MSLGREFPVSAIVPSEHREDTYDERVDSRGSKTDLFTRDSVCEGASGNSLDLLIEKVRCDLYANLQMSMDGHMAFCESCLQEIKKDFQEQQAATPQNVPGTTAVEPLIHDEADFRHEIEQELCAADVPPLSADKDKNSSNRVFWALTAAFKGGGGVGGEGGGGGGGQAQEAGEEGKLRSSKCISKAVGQKHRQQLSPFRRMISSPQFDAAVAFLIMSNCAFMGFQVENDEKATSMVVMQIMFCILFLLELVLRLCSDYRRFFQKDVMWNIFDCITVVGSIVELIIKYALTNKGSGTFLLLRCLRFLRFLRVARMLRVKAFRELRLMVQSMLCCVKPLTWTVTLLGMVIYIFSIVFAQAVNDAIKDKSIKTNPNKGILKSGFSTMQDSMYSLLSFILGGTDWLDYAIALGHISWGYKVALCSYVVFTQLALLNVVTAIFVDSSMNAALNDKQMLIQEEMMREGLNKAELEKIFNEASEGTGRVEVQQLRQYLEDEQVKTYLKVLEIHYRDAKELVRVLDTNHDGTIDVQEFVRGCLKLKSQRMVDVYSAILENRRSFIVIKEAISSMHKQAKTPEGKEEVLEMQEEMKKIPEEKKENENNEIRCELEAAVFELRTAGSNFQIASSQLNNQLKDSRLVFQDLNGNLGDLHTNLLSATASIHRAYMQIQECIMPTGPLPADPSICRQQEWQTSQKLMTQLLDALHRWDKDTEKCHGVLALPLRSCTSTTDDMTETESRPTLPSPELTNRSFLDEVLKPTDTDENLPARHPRMTREFDTSRMKSAAARLGPSFSSEKGTLTAQGGDQDPPPSQPFAEREPLVRVGHQTTNSDKPSRSCCRNDTGDGFMCLSR